MNRIIEEAAFWRYYYDSYRQLEAHFTDFIALQLRPSAEDLSRNYLAGFVLAAIVSGSHKSSTEAITHTKLCKPGRSAQC